MWISDHHRLKWDTTLSAYAGTDLKTQLQFSRETLSKISETIREKDPSVNITPETNHLYLMQGCTKPTIGGLVSAREFLGFVHIYCFDYELAHILFRFKK